MKHYVIVTDFSENALVAARFTLALAKKNRVSVSVVHAYQPFYSTLQATVYFPDDEERAIQLAERQMKQFLQKLQRLALYSEDDPLVQAVCISGNLVRALSRFHEANEIDLLIMGTAPPHEDKEKRQWPVIFELVKKIPAPLLVIPKLAKALALDNIGFFTHYQQEEKQVLEHLISMFGTAHTNYRLIYLQKASEEESTNEQMKLARWASKLCGGNNEIKLSVELAVGKEIVDLIDGMGRRSRMDILVLTKSNQSFWERLTGIQLDKTLILQSRSPLLIYN